MLRSSQPTCNCWSFDRWGCWIELFSDCCFLEMEVKLHSPHPFCTLKYDVQELVHYITLQLLTLTSCPLPLLCATSRSNCPWALLLGPLSRDKTCFYITVHQIILYSNCIALPLHYTAIVLYCVIISPCHGHGPLSRDKTQVIVFHSIFVGWDFLKRGKTCPCPCIYQNGPLVIWKKRFYF